MQRSGTYFLVLFCIYISMLFFLAQNDKKIILREAQTKEWSDVTIHWLFSPMPQIRHYRVDYRDAFGASKTQRGILEMTTVDWRDYP